MHLFYALFFWPWVIQDLRFPTRDRNCNSSIGRGRINPQTTRAALRSSCFTETSSQWRQAWARKKRNCRVEKKKRTGCWVPFQNNRQSIYDSSSYIKKCWVCQANCCSVAQSCPTLCGPVDCSTPGFPVPHYLLEFAQAHVHWFGDAIQPFRALLSLSFLCLQSFSPSVSFPVSRGLAAAG